MRILILSQIFAPELSLTLSLARELKKRGHDVQVLTGFPNYPGGKVYPGYKIRLWHRETIDDVPTLRVALYPSHDNCSFRRAMNYGSFALSSASIGLLISKSPDIVYAYDPLGNIGFTALAFRLMRGIPFVYHIADLFPDTLAVSGMPYNKCMFGIAQAWCSLVYRYASQIIVQSPGFKSALFERGVPDHKVHLVYNWCPAENDLKPLDRDPDLANRLGLANRFNVVFTGPIGEAQALDAVLDASHLLAHQFPAIQLVLVGDGIAAARLMARITNQRLTNVLLLPWRPAKQIAAILAISDVALVHLKDEPLFRITIPGKTQAYMSAGKPILMGVRGNAAQVLEEAKAGIACVPEDPRSIAEAIVKLFMMPRFERDLLGQRGRQFYQEHFSIGMAARKIESIFQLAAGERRNAK